MSWIISVGIGLLILPSLLIVIVPLIDNVFSTDFFEALTPVLGYLNFFVGSNNVNFFLVCLSVIMFLLVFRWIKHIVSSFGRN